MNSASKTSTRTNQDQSTTKTKKTVTQKPLNANAKTITSSVCKQIKVSREAVAVLAEVLKQEREQWQKNN